MTGCFVGLCTVDIEYVVGDFPQPNQKVSALEQILTAGGPAANAAITFSFLGGAASLVTAIGQHALAAIALDDLEKHGVALHDAAADPSTPRRFLRFVFMPGRETAPLCRPTRRRIRLRRAGTIRKLSQA